MFKKSFKSFDIFEKQKAELCICLFMFTMWTSYANGLVNATNSYLSTYLCSMLRLFTAVEINAFVEWRNTFEEFCHKSFLFRNLSSRTQLYTCEHLIGIALWKNWSEAPTEAEEHKIELELYSDNEYKAWLDTVSRLRCASNENSIQTTLLNLNEYKKW